jgi:hypothetical protein
MLQTVDDKRVMFWIDAKQGDSAAPSKNTLHEPTTLIPFMTRVKTLLPAARHVVVIMSSMKAPSLAEHLKAHDYVLVLPENMRQGLSPVLADIIQASKALKRVPPSPTLARAPTAAANAPVDRKRRDEGSTMKGGKRKQARRTKQQEEEEDDC